MEHIFIINPVAGQGKAETFFNANIIKTAKKMGISYKIHRTMGQEDCERFIRNCIADRDRSREKSILRFYACGGDGTLSEVINGIYGANNVEAAVIPAGTNNDFVQNFQDTEVFNDIEKQINGKAVPLDIIKYKSKANIEYVDDDEGERFCINMINMGFYQSVGYYADSYKKLPFVPENFANYGGTVKSLLEKNSIYIEVFFEDENYYEGETMLVALGNGKYCGNGLKVAPLAELQDGLLDVCIVKDMNRRQLVSLMRDYKTGTRIDIDKYKDQIIYSKCKTIKIINRGKAGVCVDGEIKAGADLVVTLLPSAIAFSLPVWE